MKMARLGIQFTYRSACITSDSILVPNSAAGVSKGFLKSVLSSWGTCEERGEPITPSIDDSPDEPDIDEFN